MRHPLQLCAVLLLQTLACSGPDAVVPPVAAGAGTGALGGANQPSASGGGQGGAAGSQASAGGGALAVAGGGADGVEAGGDAGGDALAGASAGAEEGGAPAVITPIDYSNWQLQLPIGSGTSPTTIGPKELSAGYRSEYFYVAADGGQIFMDPEQGITTSGSKHCRTEMRELTPDGKSAAWPSTGENTLTVSGQVLEVGGGASGNVTLAQVFNGSDSIPLCELEYSTRRAGFQLLYEEAKGNGSTTDLKTPWALGARYVFTLALSQGELSVIINGKTVFTRKPSPATAAKNFYFKFGNYDQTASSGTPSTTPYTVVEAYDADVVHR